MRGRDILLPFFEISKSSPDASVGAALWKVNNNVGVRNS